MRMDSGLRVCVSSIVVKAKMTMLVIHKHTKYIPVLTQDMWT